MSVITARCCFECPGYQPNWQIKCQHASTLLGTGHFWLPAVGSIFKKFTVFYIVRACKKIAELAPLETPSLSREETSRIEK